MFHYRRAEVGGKVFYPLLEMRRVARFRWSFNYQFGGENLTMVLRDNAIVK